VPCHKIEPSLFSFAIKIPVDCCWKMRTFLCMIIFLEFSRAELVRKFQVAENASIGTFVGSLLSQKKPTPQNSPAFLFVHPSEGQIDRYFSLDEFSGEIRTKDVLDFETKSQFVFLAIPTDGGAEGIRVTVEVLDVNDNPPKFGGGKFVEISLPENQKINTELPLPVAIDLDKVGKNYIVEKI